MLYSHISFSEWTVIKPRDGLRREDYYQGDRSRGKGWSRGGQDDGVFR